MLELETIDQIGELIAGLYDAVHGGDWTPHLEGTQRTLEAIHANYFATQSGPGGQQWPPLAASTVRIKGHPKILIDTGYLRESLSKPDAGVREIVNEPGNAGVSVGTDAPYSVYHDKGSQRLPKRQHVGVTTDFVHWAAEQAADNAIELMKAS